MSVRNFLPMKNILKLHIWITGIPSNVIYTGNTETIETLYSIENKKEAKINFLASRC